MQLSRSPRLRITSALAETPMKKIHRNVNIIIPKVIASASEYTDHVKSKTTK
jgi:hypothetical protein